MNPSIVAQFESVGFSYEYPGYLSIRIFDCDFTVGNSDASNPELLTVQIMRDGAYVTGEDFATFDEAMGYYEACVRSDICEV